MPHIMKGYLNNYAATDACSDADGCFHSGDIDHIDERGEFFIEDCWRRDTLDLAAHKGRLPVRKTGREMA